MTNNAGRATVKITLDISENILEQFRRLFDAPSSSDSATLTMNPEIGEGRMELIEFPGQLEFYYYWSTAKQRLQFTSLNPEPSDWYGLLINLGDSQLVRKVGATEVPVQRLLPSGMLLYPPGSTVTGFNEPDQRSESVFFRFHRSFLDAYGSADLNAQLAVGAIALYEDLDYESETLLEELIRTKSDRLAAHVKALALMHQFLRKVESRGTPTAVKGMHPDDLKGLFRAAAALRDPVASDVPSLAELAETAQMGVTKFKTAFRAVFGVPPHQYHQKIRMEYARNELLSGRQTASELSYELGYSHPSKFTAAFKKCFQQLPSQVRGPRVRR